MGGTPAGATQPGAGLFSSEEDLGPGGGVGRGGPGLPFRFHRRLRDRDHHRPPDADVLPGVAAGPSGGDREEQLSFCFSLRRFSRALYTDQGDRRRQRTPRAGRGAAARLGPSRGALALSRAGPREPAVVDLGLLRHRRRVLDGPVAGWAPGPRPDFSRDLRRSRGGGVRHRYGEPLPGRQTPTPLGRLVCINRLDRLAVWYVARHGNPRADRSVLRAPEAVSRQPSRAGRRRRAHAAGALRVRGVEGVPAERTVAADRARDAVPGARLLAGDGGALGPAPVPYPPDARP